MKNKKGQQLIVLLVILLFFASMIFLVTYSNHIYNNLTIYCDSHTLKECYNKCLDKTYTSDECLDRINKIKLLNDILK